MNTEDDEFRRIEAEAQRRAAQDDDDTQAYTSETVAVKTYRLGYEAGVAAERKACAKLCESHVRYPSRLHFAQAILARGLA